jgi:hypothetical protein
LILFVFFAVQSWQVVDMLPLALRRSITPSEMCIPHLLQFMLASLQFDDCPAEWVIALDDWNDE